MIERSCGVEIEFSGCPWVWWWCAPVGGAWVGGSGLPVPVGLSWRVLWLPSSGGCVLSAWCVPCCSSIPRIVAIIINPL